VYSLKCNHCPQSGSKESIVVAEPKRLIPGLGPKSGEMLRSAGITTLAQLHEIGSVRAYVMALTSFYALMINAYRVGNMSQVCSITRGVAPLLVVLLAAVLAGKVINRRRPRCFQLLPMSSC